LHNFQYDAAATAFRRAEQIDPSFALAYWGEAMTYNHPIWAQQDLKAARAALAKLAPTPEERRSKAPTVRERAYLQTVEVLYGDGEKFDRDRRYALVMEALHAAYPDDIDATCFYALALLGTSHSGRDVPTYMKSAALMEEVFERHPQHPGGAHYLIHSVDDAAHAPLGLRAANAYAKIAPDSSHAQHMTSHIYLALGMWKETVEANEASIRVGARGLRAANINRPFPACLHPRTWLAYGYLQQGRINNARHQLDLCADELRTRAHTPSDADQLDYDNSSAGTFFEMRARQLIDSGEWTGAVAQLNLSTSNLPLAEYVRDFTDAYGAIRFGKLDAARTRLAKFEQSKERLASAMKEFSLPETHPAYRVPEVELDELLGLLWLKEGKAAEGLTKIEAAALGERSLPEDFGPPSLHKPANELLGEVLLERKEPQKARAAFGQAQEIAPGRVQSLRGLAQCAALLSDSELAMSVNARLASIKASAGPDVPSQNSVDGL
jgi:tetratricopeptide (TPR) repeat protein